MTERVVSPAPVRRSRVFTDRLAVAGLLGAWVLVLVLVALRIDQGWVPHDDGAFAQSAERVLDGQLPHRDFAELYTGGMTLLNAVVLAVLGHDVLWLRLPMLLMFAAAVPTVYWIARRFAGRVTATATTGVAITWGLPAYPAPVPSWYQLMFAIFGAACVLKYLDTQSRRWLLLAGLLGGLSVTFKIVGAYYVGAVLLALVFIEQQTRPASAARRFRPSDLLAAGGALLTFAAALLTLRVRLGDSELLNFLLPIAAICGVVVLGEPRTAGSLSFMERLRRQWTLVGPFLGGVVVPVAALASVYVVSGTLGHLINGVLIEPRSRFDFVYLSVPKPGHLLMAVPLVAWLCLRGRISTSLRTIGDVAVAGTVAVLVLTAQARPSYGAIWSMGRALAPLVVVVGAVVIARRRHASVLPDTGGAFLLLALGAFLALVQFPFAAPIYYLYVAPLIVLAAVGTLRLAGSSDGWLLPALLACFALYGAAYIDRASLRTLGVVYRADTATAPFETPRASIRVTAADRQEYIRAVTLLRRHARGRWIFAGPDTPELYYLSALDNPTGSLFDFLDGEHSARGANLLETLRERSITVVAINVAPDLSDPLDTATLRSLRSSYPNVARTRRFEIRWR